MNGSQGGTSAQQRLLDHINASWTTQAIAVACDLELPDQLAAGTRSADELSAALGTDPTALARLLRALVTLEVLEETECGRFSLGALGHLLRKNHPDGLRNWALLNGGPLWERWRNLATKIRRQGRGGCSRMPGERFRKLEADPREAALFHAAMQELSRRVGDSFAATLQLAPGALVVDIGGGSGQLLASVLKQHASANGILFDQPHALVHAPPVLHSHGVADRCRPYSGDFFDAVPADGDVYLLKSILHDWDDEHSVRLLLQCRRVLRRGVHLVIIERLLPERLLPRPDHRALARSDLNMLVGPGGQERTLAAFRELLQEAGLRLHDTIALSAGFTAIHAILPEQSG